TNDLAYRIAGPRPALLAAEPADPDATTQRILAGPPAIGERLADDHHRRRRMAVGVAKVAAAEELNAECVQVSWAHRAPLEATLRCLDVPVERHDGIPPPHERQRRRRAGTRDSRRRTQSLEHASLEFADRAHRVVAGGCVRDACGDNAVANESWIDTAQLGEARDQKAGAGEEQHGDRRLGRDERVAETA